VTREMDNRRMRWVVEDIVGNRPARSRQHPGGKAAFEAFEGRRLSSDRDSAGGQGSRCSQGEDDDLAQYPSQRIVERGEHVVELAATGPDGIMW
jgi:hypothetical protein